MASTFKTIFEKNKINLQDAVGKSQRWYEQQIKILQGRISPYYIMRSGKDRDRPAAGIGNLYMFYYNAKWKDILPYWDKFPMVMPFSLHADGFTGLNFHYVDYGTRAYLLDSLLAINNQKLDEDTRLTLSWQQIVAVSKIKWIAEKCVHRYLNTQVMSPFKMIEPSDWGTAIMLPLAQFTSSAKKKVSTNQVWG